MGDSELLADLDRPFDDEGAADGDVLGTYLHGLFENRIARDAFVESVYASAGLTRPEAGGDRESPYDRAAKLVAEIDLDALGL
jgi:adenosylcobyric acid synthase